MPVIKYAVFHPVRVVGTVIAGVLLGMAAFYAYQVSTAITAVATEEFDPAAAREDIPVADTRNIVFVEPNVLPEEQEVDMVAFQEELTSVYDITRPFNP